MADAFDKKELLERVDNDWDFLAETVQMLQSDGRSLMQQIRDALAMGDAATVGRAAHALKGMVSNFCSPQTHAIALEVERLAQGGDLPAAAVAVATLGGQVETLLRELAEFIKERP